MLENFFILKNIPKELLEELNNLCELKVFKPGENIIREYANSTDIFFPVSGRLEYFKYDEDFEQDIKFYETQGGTGISLGEMSFIDESPRSCSIYAAEDSEVVSYVLSFEKIKKNSQNAEKIIRHLKDAVTIQISNNLRELNTQHIGALRDQVKTLKERNFHGALFIGLAATISITSLITQILQDFFPGYTIGATPTASWIMLICLLIPAASIVYLYKVPISDLGITTQNWKKSLLDGLGFTALIFGLVLAILWIIQYVKPEVQVYSGMLKALSNMTPINILLALHYLPHSYLQEFVSRGIAQTSFQRFFSDKTGILSVLMTSAFFGVGHLPFGLSAVIVTFIGGIILGFIYLRTYNLIGVAFIHYFFGGVLFQAGMLS